MPETPGFTLTADDVRALDDGRCPDCDGRNFTTLAGGSVSTIRCARCGARFNLIFGTNGPTGKARLSDPDCND